MRKREPWCPARRGMPTEPLLPSGWTLGPDGDWWMVMISTAKFLLCSWVIFMVDDLMYIYIYTLHTHTHIYIYTYTYLYKYRKYIYLVNGIYLYIGQQLRTERHYIVTVLRLLRRWSSENVGQKPSTTAVFCNISVLFWDLDGSKASKDA